MIWMHSPVTNTFLSQYHFYHKTVAKYATVLSRLEKDLIIKILQ